MGSLDLVVSGSHNPWNAPASPPVAALRPAFEVLNGVDALEISEEVFMSSVPLWKACVVGYFIGDAPHVGSIHAMVNRIWTTPGVKQKIDVQFFSKTTVLFRIENEDLRQRVLSRRYWHVADVPLVVNI